MRVKFESQVGEGVNFDNVSKVISENIVLRVRLMGQVLGWEFGELG